MRRRRLAQPDPARMDGSPSLRVDSLTLGYGRQPAVLEDVSFKVGPGVTLLVGANGAGKSTLISTLARARRPRQGQWRLNIDGVDLGERDTRLRTGLLPPGPRVLVTHDRCAVRAVRGVAAPCPAHTQVGRCASGLGDGQRLSRRRRALVEDVL